MLVSVSNLGISSFSVDFLFLFALPIPTGPHAQSGCLQPVPFSFQPHVQYQFPIGRETSGGREAKELFKHWERIGDVRLCVDPRMPGAVAVLARLSICYVHMGSVRSMCAVVYRER